MLLSTSMRISLSSGSAESDTSYYEYLRYCAAFAFVILLSLLGCGTTTSLVRVKDESIGRPHFKKIVVSTPTEDLQVRDYIEKLVAARLRGEYVTAFRAMDVLPPLREYTGEEIARRLDSIGADIILVVAVTDFWETFVSAPNMGIMTQWGGLLSAKTTSASTGAWLSIPGVTLKEKHVKLDARLFLIDVQNPPRMIWRSNSTTSSNFFIGDSKVMREAANQISMSLVADGLLESTTSFVGIVVLGGDSHEIVLGRLDRWENNKESIYNPRGLYGHSAANTVWDRESIYTSDTSACSVCNPNATNPPAIVDENGAAIGHLTLNPNLTIGYDELKVRKWLERTICKRKPS